MTCNLYRTRSRRQRTRHTRAIRSISTSNVSGVQCPPLPPYLVPELRSRRPWKVETACPTRTMLAEMSDNFRSPHAATDCDSQKALKTITIYN
eukprot:scaffold132081_cov33-Prasinocladus_malaysianus.AAC.1